MDAVSLSEANLSGAVLPQTDLSNADLSEAYLFVADLYWANLSGADFSQSIIIELQNFESTTINEMTNFRNSICDNVDFIYHTSKNTENILLS